MSKKHIYDDWEPIEICGFLFMIFMFAFVIISIVAVTIKDTTIRQDCIKAGGNMEHGECRLVKGD